jgi:hypothetical protein
VLVGESWPSGGCRNSPASDLTKSHGANQYTLKWLTRAVEDGARYGAAASEHDIDVVDARVGVDLHDASREAV